MSNFKSFVRAIRLRDTDTDGFGDISGSLTSADNGALYVYQNKIKAFLNGAESEVITSDQTQTLTNKTIDADSNTISNIDNADIKAGAAIDVTKLHDGTVDNTEFSYLNGTTSNIQTQLDSKAASGDLSSHTGASSGVHGVLGDVVGTSDTQLLTNKTIDGDNNTIQDLALSSLKTEAGSPNKFITRDASGIVVDTKDVPAGDLVGTTSTQTLTNKTIDGDDNTVQDLSLSSLKTELGSASTVLTRDGSGAVISTKSVPTGDFVGTSDAQTLGNKTLTSPDINGGTIDGADVNLGTASDSSKIVLPKNTKTNLDGLTREQASLYYASDEDTLYFDDGSALVQIGTGSGSGEGSKNFITNGKFEVDTTGWATYADAAANKPVDGTGGSATTTLTRTTSTPLSGDGSGLITKDAANRQGEGASYAFSTDNAEKNSIQRITFDYEASANYADGDCRVYIYDVTNSVLIEPVSVEIPAVEVGGKHIAEFQTSTSTSYRLIFHVASTSASAYTLKIDNIQVGPREIARGPIISDPEEFTLTTSNFGGGGITEMEVYKQRVGNYLRVYGGFITGTAAAAEASFTLPDSLSIDTTQINSQGDPQYVGDLHRATTNRQYAVLADPTVDATKIYFGRSDNTDQLSKINASDIGSSTRISFDFKVPIQGWSSNVAQSSDFGNRVIAVYGAGNGGTSITSLSTNIDFTEVRDETASWNGTQFTVPESGYYQISGAIKQTVSQANAYILYIDGSIDIRLNSGGITADRHTFFGQKYFTKGEVLSIRAAVSCTLSNSSVDHYFSISKIQSPQTLMGSEVVAANYTSNNGQSVSTSTADIAYEDKVIDTHNAYNTSTGVFTAPVSGIYRVSGKYMLNGATSTTIAIITLAKNGTGIASGVHETAAGSLQRQPMLSEIVELNKGDTIKLQSFASASTAMSGNGIYNSISINKIN